MFGQVKWNHPKLDEIEEHTHCENCEKVISCNWGYSIDQVERRICEDCIMQAGRNYYQKKFKNR